MSETFNRILDLVIKNEIQISEHAYDEMEEDDIFIRELVDGVSAGLVVEDYPDYPKGPCVLVLQHDRKERSLHVVWGIPKSLSSPAVVVTAYRPDATRWTRDFTRRRR
jgi:hypothetical protein